MAEEVEVSPERTPEEERLAKALIEQKQRDDDKACKAWMTSHHKGPMYWLRTQTKTENYQWKRDGLKPIAPFPFRPFTDGRKIDTSKFPFEHEFHSVPACKLCSELGFTTCEPDYLDVLMGLFLRRRPVLMIPKTREMMTTWAVVGYLTWFCQFYATTQCFSQSESLDKAAGNIDYANILYRQQEPWLKNKYPLKSTNEDEGSTKKIEWAHGSSYTALPSGIRKVASKHPTVYFMDEAAHIPAAEATINIAQPCSPQIIGVSSVAPGFFAEVCGL